MAEGISIGKAYVQIVPSVEGISKSINKEIEGAGGEAEKSGSGIGGKFASGFGTAMKGIGVAVSGAIAGVSAITKQAVSAYADFEQLTGGVETLFKDSAHQVEMYAWGAYKTAGLSANEYMETVTGFSASLIASLGGDTAKAGEMANQAIIDMSDNANKMGSSMESIQNAYAGFAKGQFNMLDNLKLGYGGTKTEMERLMKDAEKISGIKYNIDSYADVISAIHVMQESLDIAGTTAKEAESTISGSLAMIKADWQNMLIVISQGDELDMDEFVYEFLGEIKTLLDNVTPIIEQALVGIAGFIGELAPSIAEELPVLVNSLLPPLLDSAMTLVKELANALPSLLDAIFAVLPDLISQIVDVLNETAPMLIEAGLQAIVQFATGISQSLPTMIPTIIDVILNIVDTLIDNVDMLIDASIAMIIGLTNGLVEALPRLVEKAPEIIMKLLDALIRNAPKIVEAGVTVIKTLAKALIDNLPTLLSKIPEIGRKMVEAFKTIGSLFVSIGSDIVGGIKQGLMNAWSSIINWLISKCGEMIKTVKSFFGIHSPSTVFRDQIGVNLALGIGEGFSNEMQSVNREMEDAVQSEFDISANARIGSSMGAMANVSNGETSVISNMIAQLGERLDALSNLQIVLDSGVLVGETAPQMNTALGVLAERERNR